MKKVSSFFVSSLLMVLLCSGCATAKQSSLMALENRMQLLENKLAVLSEQEKMTSCLVRDPLESSMLSVEEVERAPVVASKMTKQQIQIALKNVGYYDGKIDGKIGPRSRAAIKQFQKDMGLKVDGVAGRQTKEKLAKYLEGR